MNAHPSKLDRRQLLSAGGLALAACAARSTAAPAPAGERDPAERGGASSLEDVLAANASVLPESGGGANHYPMAAEALTALGREDAIDVAWRTDAARYYAGEPSRREPLQAPPAAANSELPPGTRAALGSYERFGDWLDLFHAALERDDWRAVLRGWAPRLAPGIAAATFHGVIRTGHAARALRRSDTAVRRAELATGLAYWAARYVELPTAGPPRGSATYEAALAATPTPFADDGPEVDFGFFEVLDRATATPLAPPVVLERSPTCPPREQLTELVRASATMLLETLPRGTPHAIWLMHTVTGPAAIELFLPELDDADARVLTEYAWQAVAALYASFGTPYEPRARLDADTVPAWPELIDRTVALRHVHAVKLTEALARFDTDGDPLWRAVARDWLAL